MLKKKWVQYFLIAIVCLMLGFLYGAATDAQEEIAQELTRTYRPVHLEEMPLFDYPANWFVYADTDFSLTLSNVARNSIADPNIELPENPIAIDITSSRFLSRFEIDYSGALVDVIVALTNNLLVNVNFDVPRVIDEQTVYSVGQDDDTSYMLLATRVLGTDDVIVMTVAMPLGDLVLVEPTVLAIADSMQLGEPITTPAPALTLEQDALIDDYVQMRLPTGWVSGALPNGLIYVADGADAAVNLQTTGTPEHGQSFALIYPPDWLTANNDVDIEGNLRDILDAIRPPSDIADRVTSLLMYPNGQAMVADGGTRLLDYTAHVVRTDDGTFLIIGVTPPQEIATVQATYRAIATTISIQSETVRELPEPEGERFFTRSLITDDTGLIVPIADSWFASEFSAGLIGIASTEQLLIDMQSTAVAEENNFIAFVFSDLELSRVGFALADSRYDVGQGLSASFGGTNEVFRDVELAGGVMGKLVGRGVAMDYLVYIVDLDTELGVRRFVLMVGTGRDALTVYETIFDAMILQMGYPSGGE